jgi:hypothetical protein
MSRKAIMSTVTTTGTSNLTNVLEHLTVLSATLFHQAEASSAKQLHVTARNLNTCILVVLPNWKERTSSNVGEQAFWDSLPINEP